MTVEQTKPRRKLITKRRTIVMIICAGVVMAALSAAGRTQPLTEH